MNEMITRFAPSPTGNLHIGSARTALINYISKSKNINSKLYLRIEDTDQERSEKKYADAACEDLKWMNLNWQEGPEVGGEQDSYFQSERNDIYVLFYEKLLEQDLIYPCFMTEQELKVIRRNQIAAGQPPRYNGAWANASEEEVKKELSKG